MPSCPDMTSSKAHHVVYDRAKAYVYNQRCSSTPASNSTYHSKPSSKRIVYFFSFFLAAPLVFAVPLRVFCLFLRCLPISRLHQHVLHHNLRSVGRKEPLRTLLSAGLLNLRSTTNPNLPVMRLELVQCLW